MNATRHCARWAVLAAVCLAPAAQAAENPAPKDFDVLDETFRKVLRPDSTVRAICTGQQFTEGPVWMKATRCLLFSDIPADAIFRWSPTAGKSVFRKPSHQTNGNTTDKQGRLVSCEHGSRTVTRTGKDGKVTTIAATYRGKKFSSPNDLAIKSDGTIWFTDPTYGLRGRPREQKGNYVYRLDPNAAEPVAVATDFHMPNGICFSPDEKHVYIADSGRPHHVRRFAVTQDNTLAEGKVFAVIRPGGPDGMRIDADGRLYSTAGDGVQVFSPAGKLIGKIRTPKSAANCCFGGPANRTLYITARDSVYAVRLAVKGAE